MKTKVIFAAFGAVLALAASCQVQEAPEKSAGAEKVYTAHFLAKDIESKTVFGEPVQTAEGNEFPTRWSGNEDKIAVSLNLGNAKGASVNVAADYKSATFDADFTQSEVEAPFVFYALSPFSASVGASSTHGGYHLAIPSEQTPIAGSCDEAAQILAASKSVASVDEFSNIELHFSHVTAYGRLTLKNMRIPEGQAIKSIDLTASVPFAGRFHYIFADGSLEESAASRTVTLLPDNLQPSRSGDFTGIEDIWFACAPADLSGGSITVQVNTSGGKLARTVEIPQGRKLEFSAGQVSKFSVNMENAEFEQVDDRWVLVTDASQLAAGDEIILASSATSGAAYAMSTTQNTNNRGRVSISIVQDSDGQLIVENPGTSVETLKLVAGAYTGCFYLQEATSTGGRYLHSTSSKNNNYLLSDAPATATNNTYIGYSNWKISISSNVAYISSYSSNNRNYKQIRHNTSSRIFSAYLSSSQTSWTGSTSGYTNVYIYRKEAGINADNDPILEYDAYGAYLPGGNLTCGAGSQMSREYPGDGTVTFAIITPSSYEVAEFAGIPADPAKGDTFTLSYGLISGRNREDTDYNVTVLKVDGPMVWLSTGSGYGFIVKK